GEVVERARVVGLEADGFGVLLYGLLEATEAAESDAEVVMRLRPVGAKSYRLIEGVNGLREERVLLRVVFRAGLREVAEGRAEVEVRGGHVRHLRDERLEHVNRLPVLPRVVVDPREVDVGLRV